MDSRGGSWDWSREGNNIRLRDNGLPNVPGGLAGAHCTVLTWYVPACAPILSSNGNEFVIDGDMPNANGHMRKRFTNWLTRVENNGYPDNLLYYVRGALGLLTTEGEFYYDDSQNKLYLWAPGGGVPENVEYKARNWGFDLTGKSHIHIKHLNFFACEIPTNGDSLWPTNAKTWDAPQPPYATAKPTYASVQAKADAQGYVAGAHPSDRKNPAAVPDPANGILIDYCRFKYLNHQTVMVAMLGKSPPGLELSETGMQQGNSNSNFGNLHRAGIRITGDNCTIRNSVFDTASGSEVVVTGRNCTIENNYFKDSGHIGNWSSSIASSIVSTGLKVCGNTFWRAGRGHLWNVQRLADIGFNDWSEFSYLNVDGGGNYSQGRFAASINHGSAWSESQYPQYYGRNLLARKERPADPKLENAFMYEGTTWHHNWCHDARGFACEHGMCPGLYFDYVTDGAVLHHNVLWNNHAADLRAPNGNRDMPLLYRETPLGVFWVYNNTFATPRPGTDGVTEGVRPSGNTQMFYAYAICPHTIHNNIYRAGITYSPGGRFTANSSELVLKNNNASNAWLDHKGPGGAYNSSPANGKPWLIGFGPGEYACGLGLVPKPGSPAINRGTVVSALRYPNNNTVPANLRGELLTDGIERPLDYVDDPISGPNPDSGAYEFNGPQVSGAPRYYDNPGHPANGAWIPGTTLPREFIEGQPWERQWAAQ